MDRLDQLVTDHVRRLTQGLIESAAEAGCNVRDEDTLRLQRLCAASPLSLRILQQQPYGIADVLEPRSSSRFRRRVLRDERLAKALQGAEDRLMALRKAHRLEMARIALHHLEPEHNILSLAGDLSDLADAILARVLAITHEMAIKEYGPCPGEAEFAVFALGKYGGEELNFSSDIDLMFVHRTAEPTEELLKWIDRHASLLCNELQASTPYGFLYRVDTRLRPEGSRGALVPSILAVETYYHTFGEDWERQALLKLRHVAGDDKLGADILKLLTPFTYRKYIDEVEIAETLRNMDALRRRMGERYDLSEDKERDVKIRTGGIRDVEFFTQAVQILYGGQYPEIRVSNTALALQRMYESGLLHSKDHEILDNGYQVLRRVEHSLQLPEGRQNYQLPKNPDDLRKIALVAGFESADELQSTLNESSRELHRVYEGIFGRTEWEDRTSQLVEESKMSETAVEVLKEHSMADPQAAWKRLQRLASDPEHPYLEGKTKRRLQAILPRLLGWASEEPDPDSCLQQFERILESVGSRSAFYDVMKDEPQTMQVLIAIAGGSEFLTETLRRDPALVESLGRDSYLREEVTYDELQAYERQIERAHPDEPFVERLVRLQNGVELRLGLRFLLRVDDTESIGREMCVLADFVFEQLYNAARPSLSIAEEDEMLVIGFGKFGGQEMNFASDLDAACFYGEPQFELTESSAALYGGWIRTLLETAVERCGRGKLFEIDLRLRPYGRNSPPITTLDSLERYFADKAWFFERLAYTRCRPVLGAERWKQDFEAWREQGIFGPGFSEQDYKDLVYMRGRIEREKGKEIIKAGPGGLIDVEFTSQAVALAYGAENAELRSGDTCSILNKAVERGLVDGQIVDKMVNGYRFLRDVENRIRLVRRTSFDMLPEKESELDALARRVYPKEQGNRNGAFFLEQLDEVTRTLREGYVQILESLI